MADDNWRQASVNEDTFGLLAPLASSNYTLAIEEALARYHAEGIPRTRRSVQRYCANGALDAHRIETEFGEKFLITPESLERHIRYIKEVRPVTTGHDLTRPVATPVAKENGSDSGTDDLSATDGKQRQVTTGEDASRPVAKESKVIVLLERENDLLREQLKVKDQQIAEQSERARETNVLISGLQRMLSPLLSSPDSSRRVIDERSAA